MFCFLVLLAKKAVEAGLEVAPYIKTSLSPGSGVVTYYLKESGVIPALEQLGFNIVGVYKYIYLKVIVISITLTTTNYFLFSMAV